MTPEQIVTAFTRWQRQQPRPTTELQYRSEFELLIAVILSAQATDVGVNRATAKLFAVANTPAAIVKLGLPQLKVYIQTIGLYNTKGQNIIKTCELLLAQHAGRVPQTRDALQALPGVGRKTANVILNTVFGEPTIAVDTHIFRVANRTGMARGKDVFAVEQALLQAVPARFKRYAHHWLILHGRYTCTARNPKCADCVIRDLCPSGQ